MWIIRHRLLIILWITIGMGIFGVQSLGAAPTSDGAPVCQLKNASNAELREYFGALRKEIVAANQLANKSSCSSLVIAGKSVEEDLSNTTINNERAKANQLLSQTINEVRDLNLLYTNFAYNVTRIYKGHDLPLLRRERNNFKSLAKSLEDTTRNTFMRCAEDTPYRDTTLSSYLSTLYANHLSLTAYFEGVSSGILKDTIILKQLNSVFINQNPTPLKLAIQRDYTPKALSACSAGDASMQQAVKKIWEIFTKGVNMQESLRAWREAWDLLKDGSPAQQSAEKQLLSKYLSSYKITGNRKEVILRKLECRSSGQQCDPFYKPAILGQTEVVSQITQIAAQLSTIQTALKNTYKISTGYQNICEIPLEEAPESCLIPRSTAAILQSSDYDAQIGSITTRSAILYQQLTQIANQNNYDNETVSSLQSLISTLDTTNKQLIEMGKKTRSACNKQLSGEGNCDE